MTYQLALNYSIGPKQTKAVESQTEVVPAIDGKKYIVDANVATPRGPYGDNFYTVNRYCLTYQSPNECRLRLPCYFENVLIYR